MIGRKMVLMDGKETADIEINGSWDNRHGAGIKDGGRIKGGHRIKISIPVGDYEFTSPIFPMGFEFHTFHVALHRGEWNIRVQRGASLFNDIDLFVKRFSSRHPFNRTLSPHLLPGRRKAALIEPLIDESLIDPANK